MINKLKEITQLISDIGEKDTEQLAFISSRIRELDETVEARLRYAISPKLVPPKAPDWFTKRNNLEGFCANSAIQSAGELLAELESKVTLDPSRIKAHLGPKESVFLSLSSSCYWFVYPPRLAWPGCCVAVYVDVDCNTKPIQRYHRLSSTLIEATIEQLVKL